MDVKIAFSSIVKIRDKLILNPNACRLESGDPEFDIPVHVKKAIMSATNKNYTHYTASDGILELKEAILDKVKNKNKLPNTLTTKNVLVTNGGMHGLFVIFASILKKNDEVIVPNPNWVGCNSITT